MTRIKWTQNQHTAKNKTELERFWEKVDRKSSGCWEWQAATDKDGYGIFTYQGKMYKTHRLSIILDGHDIPSGMMVCHHCDNPGCVNPDHLYIGDAWSNMADKVERGRAYCPQGEKHHHAKLTENDVRGVRAAVRFGFNTKSVARIFGVRQEHVNKIVRGERWSHVN